MIVADVQEAASRVVPLSPTVDSSELQRLSEEADILFQKIEERQARDKVLGQNVVGCHTPGTAGRLPLQPEDAKKQAARGLAEAAVRGNSTVEGYKGSSEVQAVTQSAKPLQGASFQAS